MSGWVLVDCATLRGLRDNPVRMSYPRVLEVSIQGLYEVFSKYSLPEDTMPCDCCQSPNADALLHAKPLRELGWKHLASYSACAVMVWGDLNCYKHFLPRIFDLLVNDSDWKKKTPTPEVIFGVLRYGEWRTWPQEEQTAIERLLQAIWETVRSNPPIESGYIDVDQWLCCISQCENDLKPYLNQWESDDRLSASWALSSLILGSTIAYADTDPDPPTLEDTPEWRARIEQWYRLPHRGAFWNRCGTQYLQLQEWVRSPEALGKLRRAELNCGNSDMERELHAAQLCVLEAHTTKWEPAYRDRVFQSAYWDSPSYRLY